MHTRLVEKSDHFEDPESRLRHSAIAVRGLTKAFPGVLANDAVDFEVLKGEVHALLGENGSGKTTLCKSLTGFHQPDSGQLYIGGIPTWFASPADAFSAGVFMVHQHFSLVETMTVTENIVLGWTPTPTWYFDQREMEKQVAAAAERFHISIDPKAYVSSLSVGEKQKVELLKALYRGARILILDEPTTVLTPQEADKLFISLRKMADDGGAVIFISHKLDEVSQLCDHVTVLRQGKASGAKNLRDGEVDARGLAKLMIGRDIHLQRKRSSGQKAEAEPMLQLTDVSAKNSDGIPVLKDVNLTVARGEILGVAGVAGNGQLALAETIACLRPYSSGEILLKGEKLRPGDTRSAIDKGVAYIPEDRLGTGLAPGLKVSDNVILKSYRKPSHSVGPFVRRGMVQNQSKKILQDYKVKGSTGSLIRQLSGGNAQKILLARELSSDPTLLVVATPTRGLDVSAMEQVRELIVDAAAAGLSVILLSEDLGEIMDLADRIAVICGGEIQGIVDAEDADTDEIGLLMMGKQKKE